jgi:hypothetical protein
MWIYSINKVIKIISQILQSYINAAVVTMNGSAKRAARCMSAETCTQQVSDFHLPLVLHSPSSQTLG